MAAEGPRLRRHEVLGSTARRAPRQAKHVKDASWSQLTRWQEAGLTQSGGCARLLGGPEVRRTLTQAGFPEQVNLDGDVLGSAGPSTDRLDPLAASSVPSGKMACPHATPDSTDPRGHEVRRPCCWTSFNLHERWGEPTATVGWFRAGSTPDTTTRCPRWPSGPPNVIGEHDGLRSGRTPLPDRVQRPWLGTTDDPPARPTPGPCQFPSRVQRHS